MLARKTAPGLSGFGTGGRDVLDGVVARLSTRGVRADLSVLPEPKGRILCLHVDYQLAQGWRGQAAIVGALRRTASEETQHAVLVNLVRPTMKSPSGCTGLNDAFCRGATEEDDRTNQLIGQLLEPVDQ